MVPRGGALARGARSILPAFVRSFQTSAPRSLKLQPEANVEVSSPPPAARPIAPHLPPGAAVLRACHVSTALHGHDVCWLECMSVHWGTIMSR